MEYDLSSVLSLISHIHSLTADYLHGRMCDIGLSELVSSHGYILFCLSKEDKLGLGELAEKINRDKSTTTVLVRKLSTAGFVSVEKDSSDSRKKHIMLTEKGREYNEMTSLISKEIINISYQGFSDEEKNRLLALLTKLCTNIQEAF